MVQLSLRSSTTSHYSLTFAPEMESPDYHRSKGTRFPLSFQFCRTVEKAPTRPSLGATYLLVVILGRGEGEKWLIPLTTTRTSSMYTKVLQPLKHPCGRVK